VSEGLAQQMANEWEFKVREYAKRNPKSKPFSVTLRMLIQRDIEQFEKSDIVCIDGDYYQRQGKWSSKEIAERAMEILKERLAAQQETGE